MKKALIVVIIALLGICVIGGYAVLDNIFPIAAPINCPEAESITKISLTQNNGNSVTLETANYSELLKSINNAQPTRKMSVNDYPTVKTYYTVKITTPEREYRYFLYTENSQIYIEIPYEGVYKANQRILDLVEQGFNDFC